MPARPPHHPGQDTGAAESPGHDNPTPGQESNPDIATGRQSHSNDTSGHPAGSGHLVPVANPPNSPRAGGRSPDAVAGHHLRAHPVAARTAPPHRPRLAAIDLPSNDLAPASPVTGIWPFTTTVTEQLTDGGYLASTRDDTQLIPPALAGRIIDAYSAPGDLVLDPDCGAGTTLVESVRAGRRALGVTAHTRWLRLAQANLAVTAQAGASASAALFRRLALCTDQVRGPNVDLLLTTVRNQAPRQERRWSTAALAQLCLTLHEARPILNPDAHVIITADGADHRGRSVDLSGSIIAIARAARLRPVAHYVAFTPTAASGTDRRGRHRNRVMRRHDALVFQTRIGSSRNAALSKTPREALPAGNELMRCAA